MGRTFYIGMLLISFLAAGCPEQMVGAPCVSETDNRKFSTELLLDGAQSGGKTWSIETGSVQCATHVCLTQTKINPDNKVQGHNDRIAGCRTEPTEESCGAVINDGKVEEEPVILKFSFCSVRCEDGDGNRYADNPDKYDYLYECPPTTVCVKVLDKIGGNDDSGSAISEKLFGGYCVPECIENPCEVDPDDASNKDYGKVCTPSENSDEPWLWSCEMVKN